MDKKKVHEEINKHPGKLAHDNWSNLNVTYSGIFVTNRTHLLQFLETPNNNEDLRVELIQNVKPTTLRQSFDSEMLRLIHNYTASASSLVDHSRRFIKKYSGSEFSTGYDERRQAVAATGEHCFLKDFRNYLLHVGVPPIGYTIKLESNGPEAFVPHLRSAGLLKWKKWSASSKVYIKESGELVKLKPLIINHAKSIDDFYAWIFQQFSNVHGKDIDAVNELIRSTLPEHIKQERGYT